MSINKYQQILDRLNAQKAQNEQRRVELSNTGNPEAEQEILALQDEFALLALEMRAVLAASKEVLTIQRLIGTVRGTDYKVLPSASKRYGKADVHIFLPSELLELGASIEAHRPELEQEAAQEERQGEN